MTDLADALEESTYVITVPFVDEDGAAVVPTSATWTLSDDRGNIINSRENVAIVVAASVDIVLSGADLALQGSDDSGNRRFTVKATYNSGLGSGLKLNKEVSFDVTDLVNVS